MYRKRENACNSNSETITIREYGRLPSCQTKAKSMLVRVIKKILTATLK
jgi:hypothetical protein